MANHQFDWIALLAQAERRQNQYAALIVAMDNTLSTVEAMCSPQGEATDQLVQIGLDVTVGAPGSNVTREVLGLLREISPGDHTKVINATRNARNHLARALTHSIMVLSRIQRAADEIGGV